MKDVEYIIVGTAGHVDHGKTVLVNALTGIKTDRLKEEKERGISIELGFAPLTLPSGRKLGLVDVPGHERFIRQMLAGVGGMDLVMLVIAADEGVMPQTQEHLDIINLLQIKNGLVVITKKDLVEEDWLELVIEDIKEVLAGSILEGAPLIPVSALTGAGIDMLKEELDELAAGTPAKSAQGKVRLPIDRVFSMTGFGTVVTGTLWTGSIKVGDTLEIQPEGLTVRVRTLQVHGDKVETALAGQRVAVNLAGVETSTLARGSTLLTPNTLVPSTRLDLQLHLLAKAPELENQQRVRIHLGTAEVLGRVVLLQGDKLSPGETCFAQLQLEEPLVGEKGDRLVIRSYSPMYTIAGGLIIDPLASRHRRFDPQVIEALATRLEGTPEDLVLAALDKGIPLTLPELIKASSLEKAELEASLPTLLAEGDLVKLAFEGTEWYWPSLVEAGIWQEVEAVLKEYHEKYPLRIGFSKEELRSRKFASWPVKAFNGLLGFWEGKEYLRLLANEMALPQFKVEPTLEEQKMIDQILQEFQAELFQPPAWEEIIQSQGKEKVQADEVLHYLLGTRQLIRVAEGLYFHQEALTKAQEKLRQLAETQGSVQLGDMRDALGSSRKYVLPLLEYFDQIKFTKRVGDKRVLFSN